MISTAGTLRTAEDYREQAKYHDGYADALNKTLELYPEVSDQMKTWLQGERNSHRQQNIKCLKLAIKILKGDKYEQ